MNGPNEGARRRYGVRDVILYRNDEEQLFGVQFTEYPADTPPLIEVESVDRCWYRETWELKGWVVA